jgi:hypothetical protein
MAIAAQPIGFIDADRLDDLSAYLACSAESMEINHITDQSLVGRDADTAAEVRTEDWIGSKFARSSAIPSERSAVRAGSHPAHECTPPQLPPLLTLSDFFGVDGVASPNFDLHTALHAFQRLAIASQREYSRESAG